MDALDVVVCALPVPVDVGAPLPVPVDVDTASLVPDVLPLAELASPPPPLLVSLGPVATDEEQAAVSQRSIIIEE